ncbi:TolC family protein [Methylomicrobium sp. Wu6]|uniref:TolC family protein n=1 Tax=Methylomicrobium sp. Wu6 TaxID=3107928 RepID=UPI002DD67C49|nr:TolC family protein [Methylomicrobium sp. Wu6]MEC4749434.1 TolC family protein [Methylomicrobium sp. Wu6]
MNKIFSNLSELRRCKRDNVLALLPCLSRYVKRLAIPAALVLTACMPPSVAQIDKPSASIPADPAAYWHDDETGIRPQQIAAASRPQGGSLIDTKITYDLPALVDLALHANPETRVSWEEAKAAAARLERNRSAWYPTLTAMAFGQYFKTSFPIPGGALVSHGYSSYGGLDLAWTLFDFGRREATVNAGVQRLSAANFSFNRKHQEIAYGVATSFFAYQAALSRVTAAQQTLEAANAGTASVKAKFDKGLATRPDLLLAIQEQAKASYDLQDARSSAIQLHADLTASLGISPSYSLQLIDLSKLPLPAGLVQSVEKIVDQALEQRPDLLARLAELRAREAEVNKARAEFWPKISLDGKLGNQYWGDVHTHPPGNESYSASNLVGTAMLTVEWTLFDGFERSNAVREAEARKEASRAQLEALRLEIMRDIWKAYADTKTALEKREFALALLKAAEESYAATQESYIHGFSTVIELLSAQKDLARARYTEIDSRAALLRSAATLVYASGEQGQGDRNTDSEKFGLSVP